MLKPTKHSDPSETLIPVSSILLAYLRRHRTVSFTKLREVASKKARGLDALFVPSLNLLFMLGLIEYRTKTDAFEYVGSE